MPMNRFVFLFLLVASQLHGMTNEEYTDWWTNYRNTPQIPVELKVMEDYFVYNGLLTYSSNFWNHYNKLNIEQITNYGYQNFKQTVNTNYFTWKVAIYHPYAINLKRMTPYLTVKFSQEELHRQHLLFTPEQSYNYNTITMYFLNFMLNRGMGPYLEKLEEPIVGNPPFNLYNGRRVSQDIFNSLLEYMAVAPRCLMDTISTIIEVGAGSGRTAFCILSLHPDKKYVIVDFPPALYVSQTYLTDVFPDKKIFKFRPFGSFAEIADEYAEANIVFLTPDQLSTLPDHSAELFLAIDCLHEMKADRVAHYFNEAERLCTYFYYKCWQTTYVAPDNVHYSWNSYPVHSNWKVLMNEPCVVPSDFFHAMYQMH